MIRIVRIEASHEDFRQLVALLDKDLWSRYEQEQSAYETHNLMDPATRVVVVYTGSEPLGYGCFRSTDEAHTAEIKRMYILPDWRGRGVAKQILQALETWAQEEGFVEAKLETGIEQPEAISLYQRSGYGRIENYGPYRDMPQSLCFGKRLHA